MLYSKIQVLCFCILCLVCCLVYSTGLEYTAFLAGEIYVQSIQSLNSMQIEFNALNAINALHRNMYLITLVILYM